jgi:hypothetical protein
MIRYCLLLCLLALPALCRADAPPPPRPSYEKDVLPVLTQFCTGCHGGAKPKGRFALDVYPDQATALKAPKVWEKLADTLRTGDMPPLGKPRPAPEQLDALNAWLDREVFKVDCTSGKRDPGRVTIRRLNRVEYNNTIRDLFGIDIQPANDFPGDDVGYGFDNIGDVLSLPPLMLEKYLAAAEKITEQVFKSDVARNRLLNPPPHPKYNKDGARRIVPIFAERAYRRPVRDDEVRRLVGLAQLAQRSGDTADQGIRLAVQAVLVSPHFLFRIEEDKEPNNPEAIHPVSDHELASRLSYFLWSSMPDDELFRAAGKGELRKPGGLEGHVRRMLKDPRSRALVDNFAMQWLQLRALKELAPDPKLFPTFDEKLRQAMLKETELFFANLIAEDGNLLDILDANYSFLNERLARHYGIKGVKGQEFRKVTFPDDRRGGILTHASVLTITSNPTRTSPVKRGKWILETLLGTPPPPPPPGVEELKEDEQVVLKGTLRQRMEQHRANPNCAVCHQKLDPLGFGFENFNAIGAWRSQENKHPIDPSGVLPGGQEFAGPAQLRAILKGRGDAFGKCVAEKMLTYALGRGMERSDRCFINDIAQELGKNNYRFSSLVLAIVNSEPFQLRRGKRGSP